MIVLLNIPLGIQKIWFAVTLYRSITFFRRGIFTCGLFVLINIDLKLFKTPKDMFQLQICDEIGALKVGGCICNLRPQRVKVLKKNAKKNSALRADDK